MVDGRKGKELGDGGRRLERKVCMGGSLVDVKKEGAEEFSNLN